MLPPKAAKTLELAKAESEVLRLLSVRDFAGAAQAVAAYEARQANPRGIGVDWARYDTGGDVVALEIIYSPAMQASDDVRTASAMMYLWGCSKPYRRWLSREANADAAASALVSCANGARQDAADRRAREMLGVEVRTRRNGQDRR